jgi:asparagine synthase (glutamine-hydrolysing)
MTDYERQALALAKERDSEPSYKGSEPSLTTSRPDVARRMLNNTSIASNLWAVTMAHFASWTKGFGGLEPQETRARNPNGRVLSVVNSKWHPLHTSQDIWSRSILPNPILTCMGDRMEMAHSIEGPPPFLDHVLIEYVNRLPPSTKIRVNAETGEVAEKWILREAGKPFITEEVYKRKKHVSPDNFFSALPNTFCPGKKYLLGTFPPAQPSTGKSKKSTHMAPLTPLSPFSHMR